MPHVPLCFDTAVWLSAHLITSILIVSFLRGMIVVGISRTIRRILV